MAGENPEDARTGASDEFLSKTKWQRFQVLIMGPVMNLVLASLVMAVVLYQGAPVPAFEAAAGDRSRSPKVGRPGGRLQPGDRIVAVDGRPVDNWEDFSMVVAAKANAPITLEIERDGKRSSSSMTPRRQGKYEIGDIGVGADDAPRDRRGQSGRSRPTQAGLQAGRRHHRGRRRARRLDASGSSS